MKLSFLCDEMYIVVRNVNYCTYNWEVPYSLYYYTLLNK